MADTAPPAGLPGNGAAQAPSFAVNIQYIKDLSFENPRAPQVFLGQTQAPQVQVQVNVQAQPLAESIYECVLTIEARAGEGEETSFVAEIAYAGVFTLTGMPEEHHRPFLLIEGPRFLFPFARQILAEATQGGGFPPLMLNPVDFVDLYRRGMEAQAQNEAPSSPLRPPMGNA